MKKILCLIGSTNQKGYNSSIINNFKAMTNGHYVFEEIYITNLNINFCKGCSSCFKNGTCKMNDDINMLKEKLLASDIIIISSPVFMNQITGCLKNIFDRLSLWAHTMQLIGKKGIIICTTSNSGLKETTKYLCKIALNIGLDIIGTITYNASTDSQEKLIKQISSVWNNLFLNYSPHMDSLKIIYNSKKEYYENYTGIIDSYSKEIWETRKNME